MQHLPRFIGICGNPGCGKSLAQSLLAELYDYHAVDDGFALRDFAMRHLGLSRDDVYTQEGKKRVSEILNREWQHRDVLGTLGKQLEDMFGEHIMPFMAMQSLESDKRYSFGSVRKTQGSFIKARGGAIIAIRNPLAGPSQYAFDWFDPNSVDAWVENDGLARGLPADLARMDLRAKLTNALRMLRNTRLAA